MRSLQFLVFFLLLQIYKIESEEGTKPSQVDRIFKQALREFKDNLVATYSVVNKQDGVKVFNIKYKDLIANFLHVSMVYNVFQLDQYIKVGRIVR